MNKLSNKQFMLVLIVMTIAGACVAVIVHAGILLAFNLLV